MISSSDLNTVMRAISSSLQTPVVIVLLCFVVYTLVQAGTLVAEGLTERRCLNVWLPQLIDELKKQAAPPAVCIRRSGLLKRQKAALIEVTDHKELTDSMREAMAVRLIDEQQARYQTIIKSTDLVIKLGPVFGLLGTLIPLGPGIIALGQGDTYTLSGSLLTAFDTTVLGLICAAVCTVISMIRKRWYANDMSMMETLMECVLEVEKNHA